MACAVRRFAQHAGRSGAISFTFYNDALYHVIVLYDRDRTDGLTNRDIVESVSTTYGVPILASARTRTNPPVEAFPDNIAVARWENADSLLTLMRGSYTPEFQLILVSKSLSACQDRPRREAAQRKKEAGEASAARDKTRIANKAAFGP